MHLFRRLPSFAVVALLATLLGCVTAFANPVTYSFSGSLTDIRGTGVGFSLGDHFDALYTHDDTPQSGSLIEPGRMLYSGGQFAVEAAGQFFIGPMSSELQIFNNWTYLPGGYDNADGYFVSSYIYDADYSGFTLIQFDLWDHSGATLSSLEMPTQAEVQDLAHDGRVFIRRFENGTEVGLASGNFSTFTSVPDGGSMVMLVGGAFIGLVALRRQIVT